MPEESLSVFRATDTVRRTLAGNCSCLSASPNSALQEAGDTAAASIRRPPYLDTQSARSCKGTNSQINKYCRERCAIVSAIGRGCCGTCSSLAARLQSEPALQTPPAVCGPCCAPSQDDASIAWPVAVQASSCKRPSPSGPSCKGRADVSKLAFSTPSTSNFPFYRPPCRWFLVRVERA